MSLDDIATRTRIKRELLDALERNDLREWPRGLYARAWIRAYADSVGLDPADTVAEFCRLFPQGDRRAGTTLQAMASIVAHASEYRDEFGHIDRRGAAARRGVLATASWRAAVARPFQAVWLRLSLKPSPVRLKRTARTSS